MRKLGTKGVREQILEEPPFANLAPYVSPEESASHNFRPPNGPQIGPTVDSCGPDGATAYIPLESVQKNTIIQTPDVICSSFDTRKIGTKGVRAHILEDPPFANLPPYGILEESASHHYTKPL